LHGLIPPDIALPFLPHPHKVSLQLREIPLVSFIYVVGLRNYIRVYIARVHYLSGVRARDGILHSPKLQSLSLPILMQTLEPIFHFAT
jgi:hypothetical protein